MYTILFINNDEYSHCLTSLFSDGVEEGGVTRNVTLYSGEKTSKVVSMFMVKERQFKTFVDENPLVQK
jgi:hypothetical protein